MITKVNILLLLAVLLPLGAAEKPIFHAFVTSGWNEKPDTEFTIRPDRTFVWRSGKERSTGTLPPAAIRALILHIEAAKPGPAANDVGTLQLSWQGKAGQPVSKLFYFPRRAPASELIQEIQTIATRYGKQP